jgi:hypothetical protein
LPIKTLRVASPNAQRSSSIELRLLTLPVGIGMKWVYDKNHIGPLGVDNLTKVCFARFLNVIYRSSSVMQESLICEELLLLTYRVVYILQRLKSYQQLSQIPMQQKYQIEPSNF